MAVHQPRCAAIFVSEKYIFEVVCINENLPKCKPRCKPNKERNHEPNRNSLIINDLKRAPDRT
jgi:hypothetical protein